MRKNHRGLRWAGVLVTLAGIGLSVGWLAVAPEPTVSLTNFRRIKLGMSVGEVEAIFGVRGELGPGGEGEYSWSWRQGGNYAGISFGQEDGKATCGYYLSPDGKQHWLPRQK